MAKIINRKERLLFIKELSKDLPEKLKNSSDEKLIGNYNGGNTNKERYRKRLAGEDPDYRASQKVWTLAECKKEALKYDHPYGINGWEGKHQKTYQAAKRKTGWFAECIAHMSQIRTKWTFEKCLKSAKKYNTISLWQIKDSSAYVTARNNNWLTECTKHMKVLQIKWTKELCLQKALKYKTVNDWRTLDKKSYNAASKNKWIDFCISEAKLKSFVQNKKRKWTIELCISDSLKYKHKGDWYKNSPGAYTFAKNNNVFNKCTSHMVKKQITRVYGGKTIVYRKWILKSCQDDALKYNSIKEWRENSTSYKAAYSNGWIKQCSSHMKTRETINKENSDLKLIEIRKFIKINNIKSRTELIKLNRSFHHFLATRNLLDSIFGKYEKRYGKYKHTKEECLKISKKYNTPKEWQTKDPKSWYAAYRNKWIEACYKHMEIQQKHTLERSIKLCKGIKSLSDLVKINSGLASAIKRNKWEDFCFKKAAK